jgi:hypothetical protein
MTNGDSPNARLYALHERILEAAQASGTPLKLVGGMAIELRSGPVPEGLGRTFGDLDYIARRRDRRAVEKLFELAGFVRDPASAQSAHRRQVWEPPEGGEHVDVFLGAFEMCHTLHLEDRLGGPHPALPAADLLLTKLQIVELNDKDRTDLIRLLSTHLLGDSDADGVIELAYLTGLLGSDWGLFTTVTDNLRVLVSDQGMAATPEGRDAAEISQALLEAAEAAPKSSAFRMRARLGRRKQWYRLPEELLEDGA